MMIKYAPTIVEVKQAIELHALWLRGEPGGMCASFIGCNLKGMDLSGAILDRAHMDGCVLTKANLTNVSFRFANLTGADMSGADLTQASMVSAWCAYLNLTGANTLGLDLTDAFIRGIIGYIPIQRSRDIVPTSNTDTARSRAGVSVIRNPVPC